MHARGGGTHGERRLAVTGRGGGDGEGAIVQSFKLQIFTIVRFLLFFLKKKKRGKPQR